MNLRTGVGEHHFPEVSTVVGRCGLYYLLDVALGFRCGVENAFGGGVAAEEFDGVADQLGDGVVVVVLAGGVGYLAVAEGIVAADVGADVYCSAHAAIVVAAADVFAVDALQDGLLEKVWEEEGCDVEGAVLPELVTQVEDVDCEDFLEHILHKPIVVFGAGETRADGKFSLAAAYESHYVACGEAAVIGEGDYKLVVNLVIVVVFAAREEPDIVLVLVNERVNAAVGDVPQIPEGLWVADDEVAAVVVCRYDAHYSADGAGSGSVATAGSEPDAVEVSSFFSSARS